MRMHKARVHGPDYLHIALRSGDLRISALLWVRSLHRPSTLSIDHPSTFQPLSTAEAASSGQSRCWLK